MSELNHLAVFPRTGEITLDFSHSTGGQGDSVEVWVPASWVKASSVIVCQPSLCNTADHDPEDWILEELTVGATDLEPGVRFKIMAYAPHGTWGRYRVAVIALAE